MVNFHKSKNDIIHEREAHKSGHTNIDKYRVTAHIKLKKQIIISKSEQKWTYWLFVKDYKVLTISTKYVFVSGIIMPSLKSKEQ